MQHVKRDFRHWLSTNTRNSVSCACISADMLSRPPKPLHQSDEFALVGYWKSSTILGREIHRQYTSNRVRP